MCVCVYTDMNNSDWNKYMILSIFAMPSLFTI